MRLKIKAIILLLFFNVISIGYEPLCASSQQKNNSPLLDQEEWKKLADDIDYTENYKTWSPKNKDPKVFKRQRSKMTFNGIGLVRIILYIIIIGVLVVVLYLILKNFLNFFDERVPSSDLKNIVENLEENIHEADFETLLANALTNKEFKLAVRILYLKTIKQLADKEIIKWKKEKTNGHYIREIASPKTSSMFSFLTLAYENAWFSTYQVDEAKYKKLSRHFYDFINQLN